MNIFLKHTILLGKLAYFNEFNKVCKNATLKNLPAWRAAAESCFLASSSPEFLLASISTCSTVTAELVGVDTEDAAPSSARRFRALSRATSLFCAIFWQSGHWQFRKGQSEICTADFKPWALHLRQNRLMVLDGSDILIFIDTFCDKIFFDVEKTLRNGEPWNVTIKVTWSRPFSVRRFELILPNYPHNQLRRKLNTHCDL